MIEFFFMNIYEGCLGSSQNFSMMRFLLIFNLSYLLLAKLRELLGQPSYIMLLKNLVLGVLSF